MLAIFDLPAKRGYALRMKLRQPETRRQARIPAKEVWEIPVQEPIFKLEEFLPREIWQRIDEILLEQLNKQTNLREAAENFIYATLALSVIDPAVVNKLRSNEQAKTKIRSALEELASSDDATHNLSFLSIYWLFPDLPEIELIKFLRKEAYEETQQADAQGFMDLMLIDPSILNTQPISREVVVSIMKNAIREHRINIGDPYLAKVLLIEVALFKSLLMDPEPVEKLTREAHADNTNIPVIPGDQTELDPVDTTLRLLNAALVRAAWAEKVEVTKTGFVITDRLPTVGSHTPLPDRPAV